MLRRTTPNAYYLAFNAKAKARPNIGLKGVGHFTIDNYHKKGQSPMGFALLVFFGALWYGMEVGHAFAHVDAVCGGGPQPLKYDFFQGQTTKPWEFNFNMGEGYAAGPARLRPAPGAIDFGHH